MSKLRYFRIYFLDGAKHIVRVEEFRARSEQEAVAAAQEASPFMQCEVWEGNQLIAQVGD
ncbi:MAG: hypothetical protein ACLGHC_00625 [Alphaproteobacteria bacterium]